MKVNVLTGIITLRDVVCENVSLSGSLTNDNCGVAYVKCFYSNYLFKLIL